MQARVERLGRPGADHLSLAHTAWCAGWISRSFLHILSRAAGLSRMRIREQAASADWTQRRAGWQCKMTSLFAGPSRGQAHRHLRRRLDRWPLAVLPGHRVDRATRILEVLGRRSVPRVQAALLRTWCNGWCTRRRFQQTGQCRLRCGTPQDSIEHYAQCSVARQLLLAHLHARGFDLPRTLDAFLCMTVHAVEDEIIARGTGLYAAYRLFNLLRAGGLPHADMAGAFRHFVQFASS